MSKQRPHTRRTETDEEARAMSVISMYLTRCDVCNKIVDAGSCAFGSKSKGLYNEQDVCIECQDRLRVWGCGYCGAIYSMDVITEQTQYKCPNCLASTEEAAHERKA